MSCHATAVPQSHRHSPLLFSLQVHPTAVPYAPEVVRMCLQRQFDIDAGLMALSLASHAHARQVRSADGSPYIGHPVHVALAYAQHASATQTGFLAALMHDVIEDNPVYAAAVQDLFGVEMKAMVDVLSKSPAVPHHLRSEEAFGRLLSHVDHTADACAALIKLTDRCHNAVTSAHLSAGQREKLARECEHWYAPLAAKLHLQNLGKWLTEPAQWTSVKPHDYLFFMHRAFMGCPL